MRLVSDQRSADGQPETAAKRRQKLERKRARKRQRRQARRSPVTRLRMAVRRFRLGPCPVCGARRLKARTVTDRSAKAGVGTPAQFRIRRCTNCGHVGNPDNTHDYRAFERIDALPDRARIGTPERQGREFHMARMAVDILGRRDLDVLVFGAGRSFDNQHIAGLPEVRGAAIADIMRLRDDAEFIDANLPAPRRFDIVIASEVVEHFLEPRADFAHLLSYVKPGGLLVCSTNLYDGGRMAKHHYLFLNGHVAYYTAKSAGRIAAANNVHLDIRTPLVATGYGGVRKRYLLFTDSDAVAASIVEYFKDRPYAPSESPTANIEMAEARRLQEEAAITPAG